MLAVLGELIKIVIVRLSIVRSFCHVSRDLFSNINIISYFANVNSCQCKQQLGKILDLIICSIELKIFKDERVPGQLQPLMD